MSASKPKWKLNTKFSMCARSTMRTETSTRKSLNGTLSTFTMEHPQMHTVVSRLVQVRVHQEGKYERRLKWMVFLVSDSDVVQWNEIWSLRMTQHGFFTELNFSSSLRETYRIVLHSLEHAKLWTIIRTNSHYVESEKIWLNKFEKSS